MHRADDAQVINARRSRLSEQLTDFDPALAVLVKLERRFEGTARLAFGTQRQARKRFAMIFFETWFGIERVDLRRPAIHKEMDHSLGLRGQWSGLRSQRHVVARRSER